MLNLTIKKEALISSLSKVQTIVDKKTIMNIINNVFLYTDEDNLYLEATDLEISYRGMVPCSVSDQGAVTVSARKLYEIVKEFPSDKINIKEDENIWLTIGRGERAEYRIGGLPPDDFPRFRKVKGEKEIELPASLLKEMIEKTIYAASLDESKYSLAGIFFEEYVDDEGRRKIRLVSSDGHRLSLIEKPVEGDGLGLEGGIIIPRKGAHEIRKLIEGKQTVRFGVEDNYCFAISDNDQLVIRLVDGRFPDYRAIIPEEKIRSFTFNRLEIYNALKRISILSSDSTFRGVKAYVGKNTMNIETLQKDIGEARETVSIKYEKEPFRVAFNAKYLMEVLNVMESEVVEMTVNSSESPCLLRGENDEGFLGLIMPMSLAKEEK